jgi:sugar O-acyltransferase (sialic acid O-acetyltransferase NeuD family)
VPTLLLLGAGGHARVVADAALRQGRWEGVAASGGESPPSGVDAQIAADGDRSASRVRGGPTHAALPGATSETLLPTVPLIGRAQALKDAAAIGAMLHIAIGANPSRRREAQAVGIHRLASVLHPQASVSPHARLGPGCFIAAHAVVGPLATLGAGVIVNHGAVVDHDAEVGDFAHIAPGATLAGAARVAPGVLIGAGARLMQGVAVCEGATIGAGAVVTKDITEPGTYAGIPARRLL